MGNSILEVRLTNLGPVAPEKNVIFNEQVLYPTGIGYDNTTGVITFKEAGQYAIKWWVATETTLKGPVGFHLISSQLGFIPTPGWSPIKTGQVTGFGAIDIGAETTMSLINKSATDVMISRKCGTKAYLLVTPIGSPSLRAYRGNISTSGSFVQAPVGDQLYFRLEYVSGTACRLVLAPINGAVNYDYRRLSGVDGGGAMEGSYADNSTLSGSTVVDPTIYNNSREMYGVFIRTQNPDTGFWSLYVVRCFISAAGARVTIWVETLEEEVSY